MNRRRLALVLLSVIVLASLIYASSIHVADRDGVRIVFKLVDVYGRSVDAGEVVIKVRVKALTPPPQDPVIVKNETLWNGELILDAKQDLGRIVDGWSRFEAARLGYTGIEEALRLNFKAMLATKRSLVVEAHVLSLNATLLARVIKYIPYSPVALYMGNASSLEYEVGIRLNVTLDQLKKMNENPKPKEYFLCETYYWEPVWRVDTEDIVNENPDIPQATSNNVDYIAIPLLVVDNEDYGPSGPPGDGIFGGYVRFGGAYTASFRVALGVGPQIEAKIDNGQWDGGLNGNIGFSAGASYEDNVVVHEYFDGIDGGEILLVYFYGRPVIEFYKEVYRDLCTGYMEYTGMERLDVYIEDLYVHQISPDGAKRILDDAIVSDSLPSWIGDLLDTYYYTHTLQNLILPSGVLSDGVLQAGEEAPLEDIYFYLDSGMGSGCEDFDATIPVGLSLAVTVSKAASKFAPLTLAISLAVNLSGDADSSSGIKGFLKNVGGAPEILRTGYSILEYRKDPPWQCAWCPICYYEIPLLYVEGR